MLILPKNNDNKLLLLDMLLFLFSLKWKLWNVDFKVETLKYRLENLWKKKEKKEKKEEIESVKIDKKLTDDESTDGLTDQLRVT